MASHSDGKVYACKQLFCVLFCALSMMYETSTRKIIARLKAEGWLHLGGSKHDKFGHPTRPDDLLVVPRHKEQSPGVARSIARMAGWIKESS